MSELAALIRRSIEAEGPMPLARFMQLALQHPEYGYYVSGDPLGREGDFITAPEVSQLFGEMIGVWCVSLWHKMGSPPQFVLLELGPGRGTLMADALRASAKVPGFHDALRLYLLDSNATLRDKQAETLAGANPRWIEDCRLLPPLPLIVVANEFFDALPIHQYEKKDGVWRERLVDWFAPCQLGTDGKNGSHARAGGGDGDSWVSGPFPNLTGGKVGWDGTRFVFCESDAPVALPLPPDLSFYEISPQAIGIVQDLAAMIAERGGGALIVDYGFAEPPGEATLQAVSGHSFADPLERPGEVDLTAHVDFAALRIAAEKAGAKVAPLLGQGEFLCAMGIELRAALLKRNATQSQVEKLDSGLQRLVNSDQMGALFKAMAFTRKDIATIPGFP